MLLLSSPLSLPGHSGGFEAQQPCRSLVVVTESNTEHQFQPGGVEPAGAAIGAGETGLGDPQQDVKESMEVHLGAAVPLTGRRGQGETQADHRRRTGQAHKW